MNKRSFKYAWVSSLSAAAAAWLMLRLYASERHATASSAVMHRFHSANSVLHRISQTQWADVSSVRRVTSSARPMQLRRCWTS